MKEYCGITELGTAADWSGNFASIALKSGAFALSFLI